MHADKRRQLEKSVFSSASIGVHRRLGRFVSQSGETPAILRVAHRRARAVPEVYGRPHDLDDEKILERLLALNLERTGA